MYTRAYTEADKAAFIGQVGLGSAGTAGSGTYLPVAPGTGRQRRLNVPICPRAFSGGDSSSPPFCAARASPRSPLDVLYKRHHRITWPLSLSPPWNSNSEEINRPDSLVLFLRSRPNEFIRDISRREILACVFAVFFLKKKKKRKKNQANRSGTLQNRSDTTAYLAYNQRNTITQNWPKWISNIYESNHCHQSSAIELLLYSKSFSGHHEWSLPGVQDRQTYDAMIRFIYLSTISYLDASRYRWTLLSNATRRHANRSSKGLNH